MDSKKTKPEDQPKSGDDNLLFNGKPDFGTDEGAGGTYNSQKSKSHKWFERDHIVDKSYPNNVKGFKLLREGDAEAITAKIKRETKKAALSNKVANRLKWLKGQKLYPKGSNMAGYSTGTGYSVILYSVIAKRVNSRLTGAMSKGDLEAQIGTGAMDELSTYVRRGDTAKLKPARKERAKNVDQSIVDRALHHSLVVAEEYNAEPEKVANAQSTEPEKQEAKAQMTKIVSRLHASLKTAQEKTTALKFK